ncbi:MAG: endonuclease/exonuclease/phosphatase family protein, partial [Cyclobacteriaceae bacterium]
MTKNLLLAFCFMVVASGFLTSAQAQSVFINEIHYDNASTDVNEGVEIAGPEGTDLSAYSIVLYNGNGGGTYNTVPLSGTLTNLEGGFGAAFFSISGIQNGGPDGIALVQGGTVVQFLSYEGSFTATNGPASGMTSQDIGVEESFTTEAGLSLQLEGTGVVYSDFTWALPATSTYDEVNTNQTFGDGTPGGGGGDCGGPDAVAKVAFINEIHYDNSGSDTNEGVEIAGLAGLDLTGWTLVAYNGNDGSPYNTVNLNGVLADDTNGWGLQFYAISGLQNGSPDGIALVDDEGTVVQFLSYEGSFVASGGPADGMTSEDIGVSESSGTAVGFSLQLIGTGSAYADFTWAGPLTSTYGAANTGQTFVAPEPVLFVNELHYDNSGSDTGEGIEIAGTAGTDLTGYSLVLYNGNGGSVYNTIALSGTIPNQDNGYGTLFFAVSGLQNGSPDGFAFVDAEGAVIQFLSYEGSFDAVGGAADGLTSVDLGVSESSGTQAGFSLQLTGTGTSYDAFTWSGPSPATYGEVNTDQSFGGSVDPEPEESDTVSIATARTLSFGTEVVVCGVLTVTDQLGGPAFIEDATGGIALFDSQVQGEGNFAIGDNICIRASIGAFNGQVQLVDVTELTDFGPVTPAEPSVVTIDQLAAVEGQLVTLTVDFADAGVFFPNSNYSVSDATGTTDVRIDADVASLVGMVIPEGTTTVTGVVGSFRGSLQVLPRFEADVPAATPYEPEGSDLDPALTLDVATWNMEFFGATQNNFGPNDVQLQLENAVTIVNALNADVIAVQEVSDEALLGELASRLDGNYATICSDVYSFSFREDDGTFPPQKLCYIYNTDVIDVLNDRVVFDEFYTQVRTNNDTEALPNYPDDVDGFWASGRLPYLLEVEATVDGVTEEITLVNIHAVSNSRGIQNLERRAYDVQVLKDTLDTYYADDQVIVLGDYNDDVDEPVLEEATTQPSPYEIYVNDPDYWVVTKSLSEAGFRTFVFRDNVIDHITITDELYAEYIEGSEQVFIPFNLVFNYANTTSDHIPVLTRFELFEPLDVMINGDLVVYKGYGPEECTTLTASVTGGKGEYTYSWSNGETTASIEVCPSATTTYTLVVTDERGNTEEVSVTVCAIDATCGNGRGKQKLNLCWNIHDYVYVQLCLPEHLADFFIRKGANIGACFAEEQCAGDMSMARAGTSVDFMNIESELSIT